MTATFKEILQQAILDNLEEVKRYRDKKEIETKFSHMCTRFSSFICRYTYQLLDFKKVFPNIVFIIPTAFNDPLICTNGNRRKGVLDRKLVEGRVQFSIVDKGEVIKELNSVSLDASIQEAERAFEYALSSFLIELMGLHQMTPYATLEELLEAAYRVKKNSNDIERINDNHLSGGISMFIQGETVERFGSLYLVEKVYQITEEYMKKHNLYYKDRVTLKKLFGENGPAVMDFAITN